MSEHKRNIQPDSLETRTALLEQSIGHINQTLVRLENTVKEEFIRIHTKIDSNFKWIIGLLVVPIYSAILEKIFKLF